MITTLTNQLKTRCVLRASFFVVGVWVFLAISGCSRNSFMLAGETMGTRYHITIANPPKDLITVVKLKALIDEELELINQLMSTYISDSEISRFNRTPVGQWFDLSPLTYQVLAYSLELSEQTSGKFDVTVSPLVNLWGFGEERVSRLPSNSEVAWAKQKVGWQGIVFNDKGQVKKTKPLSINLSALAKGYGVDHIAQLLDKQGIAHYLVEIGGEIRVKGKNKDGLLWKVGVETPTIAPSGTQKIISLDNKAVATSGDYRNFFFKDGVRYSHTIDPDSGHPVAHNIASLTVIAQTAMQADALATAFMVLGEKQAIAMATQLNIAIYILLYDQDNNFEVAYSPAFIPYLTPPK